MADQWYYARGEDKLGPFSARQLRDLADAGRILPTDTVWKAGIEKGVSAARVKNLFPLAPADSPPVDLSALWAPTPPLLAPRADMPAEELPPDVAAPDDIPGSAPASGEGKQSADKGSQTPDALQEDAEKAFEEEPAPIRPLRSSQPSQPKKGRAVAVKGAVLISQDGQSVQYRKKCCKCGNESASKNRMPIRHGLTRASFFCPKCRKLSPVLIQGMM
jgi:GYF domain 2